MSASGTGGRSLLRRLNNPWSVAVFGGALAILLSTVVLALLELPPFGDDSRDTQPAAGQSGTTTGPRTGPTTTTSAPSAATPYHYTSAELDDRLLTGTEVSSYLSDVSPTERLYVLGARVCMQAASTVRTSQLSEQQPAEFEGRSLGSRTSIGSELLQFRNSEAAAQFLSDLERAVRACGWTVRLSTEPIGDEVLRYREDAARVVDRVFFRKGNLVGQVATALPPRTSQLAAEELVKVLAARVP